MTRTTFYFESVRRRLCNSRAMTSTCCWNRIRLSQYAACATEQLSSERTQNMGRKKKKQSKPWCWYPFFSLSILLRLFFIPIELTICEYPRLLLIKIIYYVFFFFFNVLLTRSSIRVYYTRIRVLGLGGFIVINIDFYPLVVYNTFVWFLSWLIVVSVWNDSYWAFINITFK